MTASPAGGDETRIVLSVPTIRCGGCIATVEDALGAMGGVDEARVNLTLRRVGVTFRASETSDDAIVERLASLGYPALRVEDEDSGHRDAAPEAASLLRAIAVSGFGAMNIMLMSVAVWAGADGATRETFHLLSGLIAVPVVAYSGRAFFASALAALRGRQLNMDVPISLAVLLALGLSLTEAARGGAEVFFDAAVTLLFFLLIGRYLDQSMRERVRSAVGGLARLAPDGGMRLGADGSAHFIALAEIAPGMTLRLTAGERVPVDVRILRGAADLDRSLVTGESAPVAAQPGDELEAGTLVLTGSVDADVLRPAAESFLAGIARMLQHAERGRGLYVRIADRAARLYAPVVHLLAAFTFIGWVWASGDWQRSLFVAVSVLIITCPCALALAVPAVHVVAAGRLFREGILLKDGGALERLAEIDHVVFDKTGTLTTGLTARPATKPSASVAAAIKALALHSSHPASKAVAAALRDRTPARIEAVEEIAGAGVEGWIGGRCVRLGRADWVLGRETEPGDPNDDAGPVFAFAGEAPIRFEIAERLRPAATEAVAALQSSGLPVEILSGDRSGPVGRIAFTLGIRTSTDSVRPAEKLARLEALRDEGRRVLMVGDGLNDAAALAAAHVAMAPAAASDVGLTAADIVLTREPLDAVVFVHDIAQRAASLVRQNFALAVIYNCIAIPLAAAGMVTPLIAALAMSSSSIIVVANALRLECHSPREAAVATPPALLAQGATA